MEHCSRQHLELLATSLEPILHLDFSSTLVPPMAALHLDGVTTFHIQRGVTQSVLQAEVLEEREGSLSYLSSIPTTLLTGTSDNENRPPPPETLQQTGDGANAKLSLLAPNQPPEKVFLLPALPLTHPSQHATDPLGSHRTSLEGTIAIRRKRFSSVPDYRSTADLLKHIKDLKPRQSGGRCRRSRSVGTFASAFGWKGEKATNGRDAEEFKAQLDLVSEVRSLPSFFFFFKFSLLPSGWASGQHLRMPFSCWRL